LLLNRKQLNIFKRKIYRRILGPVHDNEKENWRILTNKEIFAMLKKTYTKGCPTLEPSGKQEERKTKKQLEKICNQGRG
jgi:hypothetical protein